GVLDIEPSQVVEKGRLQPGRMFLVDTAQGRIVGDDEIKSELAAAHPYAEWLERGRVDLAELPERRHEQTSHLSVLQKQQTFGYTTEEIKVSLEPMARAGAEPIGSMGTDTPIAVLSDRPRLLFDYFSQLFAQVTNPPLDAIREELVTATSDHLGPKGNLLQPGPDSCHQLFFEQPVIDNDELAKIIHIGDEVPEWRTEVIRCLFPVAGGGEALGDALDRICQEASAAIEAGATFLVLSDRLSTADWAPIPSLLAVGAVHHHLVREKTRTKVGLIAEAGDAREVHHICLLLG